jgi:translocation and assembly module TamB
MNTRVAGNVACDGEATLDANNRYGVSGHMVGANLAFAQGSQRVRHADLSTDVYLTPERLELSRLRLAAFGGELDGDATLENFAQYSVRGNIRHLNLQQALLVLDQRLPYDGSVSGNLQVSGDLHTPGTRGLEARARLNITPGRGGAPLEGRLQADYSAARDDVTVENSYLALPRTHLTISGSLQHRLKIALTTRDLHDLPVTQSAVTLTGGQATFRGAVTGGLTAPHIAGHLGVKRFQVQGRPFDSLGADLAASGTGAAVHRGILVRGAMQASFEATAGLREWKSLPTSALSADANLQNGDLADLMVLAGQPNPAFSGALTANLHAGGTIGNPSGSAGIHLVKGTLENEPFDRLDVEVNLSDQLAGITSATLTAGPARVDLAAEFRHPRDSFTTGQMHARLHANLIDLAQVRTLEKLAPDTAGRVEITADAAGDLSNSGFLLTSIQADASARAIHYQAQPYGDFQLEARTSGQAATLKVTSNFAGSSIHVKGTTQLVRGYPTIADAHLSGFAIESALMLAHRSDTMANSQSTHTCMAHLRARRARPPWTSPMPPLTTSRSIACTRASPMPRSASSCRNSRSLRALRTSLFPRPSITRPEISLPATRSSASRRAASIWLVCTPCNRYAPAWPVRCSSQPMAQSPWSRVAPHSPHRAQRQSRDFQTGSERQSARGSEPSHAHHL